MVVWFMTDVPEPPELDLESLTISTVPIPDHMASADPDESPTPMDTPPPPPPRKRRLLGTPDPGSRDSGPRSQRKIKKPLPPIPRNGFAPGIEKMYGAIALAVMPLDMEFASAIMQVAPEAAKAWDELARRNEAVRRMLTAMMETTAWGAVIAAHVPLMLLLMNRMFKGDPRISMLGSVLAQQAEDHANGENPEAA
jgi:hypothetical protein